jgi:glycosyltransferase involved in cell wall biosynthesis
MRVLQVLTYYRPHTSGLTIYVERLSRALAGRGHEVTVLTSRFDPRLPREERADGVRVRRVPVLFRISKGVVMPTFGLAATRQVLDHDVIHLHLPQLDAAGVALRGRLLKRPTVITYHCDLQLPAGPVNRLASAAVWLMNHLAARLAHRIVTYTDDFAFHSPYLDSYRSKVEVIPPPVELPTPSDEEVEAFAARHNPDERRPVIGMAARLASEKGVEVLLKALPAIARDHPQALVLFAGQHRDVLGEEAYRRRIDPTLRTLTAEGRWRFLGVLSPAEMAAFYRLIDVLAVPSLNSTESFGLVQVEAMMSGVPVVASNLPGVRQPVRTTGMGLIAEVGSGTGLAAALSRVLADPAAFAGDPAAVAELFAPGRNAAAYEALYARVAAELEA